MSRSRPAVLVMCFFFASCGSSQTGPEPLCFAAQPESEHGARELRAAEWAALLLGEGARMGQRSPGQDCVSETIAWPANDGCGAERDHPSPVELTEDSVITRRLSATQRLVWVVTHRYPNGEGLGPVALVEKVAEVEDERPEGWGVRVVGPLRSYTERARLRLEGSGFGSLLVVEGDKCTDPDDTSTCERTARFIPVRDDRFVPSPVQTRGGRCIGPATVWTARRTEVELDDGWERTFALSASFEYDSGVLTIHEQVTADDEDPQNPEVPPRRFRLVDSDRTITVQEGRLIARGTPLWDRMLRLHGGTRYTEREVNQLRQAQTEHQNENENASQTETQ